MDTYGKLCTEFYDLSKPVAPTDALEFYLRHFNNVEGPVLEPMCGSGRFLIPFLEKSVDIDGADASTYMLQACYSHCEEKGLHPKLYQQLLQELDLPRQYGYIFIPAGSFGLIIDKKDAEESLRSLHRHLSPGGKLIIEIETTLAQPEAPGKWHEWRLTRPDGTELVFSALPMYDSKSQIQEDIHRYQLFNNGQLIETEVEQLSLRLYEPAQFQRLLEDAAFTNIQMIRAYEGTKISGGEKVVIFQCQKI